MVFISLWIDKGFGLIIGGFVPNMFETVTEYWPTMPETLISIGVWAAGFLVLTILYKIAITVREETAGVEIEH
jgi:molybdopterin-containing oxidoreductase family membrane subunit